MKKAILILSLILFWISFCIIYIYGRQATVEVNNENMRNVSISYDNEIIKCAEKIKDGKIVLDITPVKEGITTIKIEREKVLEDNTIEQKNIERKIYVHKLGIITTGIYLGHCKGDIAFVISFYLILIMIVYYMIKQYRKNIKDEPYSYKNVRQLGLIIFLVITLSFNIAITIYDYNFDISNSIEDVIKKIEESMGVFQILILPFAIILTIIITISNLVLIKKEGKSWRNLLGVILGGFICLLTIITLLQSSLGSNFHSIKGMVYNYFCNVMLMYIAYIECILLGTIVSGYKAAKKIPEFNKDYIIILGCHINSDGSLTPLLKSRVDRAIEFSKMQKEKTGKEIKFVPSGGQGSDETISEAEAMKKYLIDQGIDESKIIVEDKSTNTYENMRFSNELIKKENKNAKIAFSTTNYHVFRAGIIAHNQNIKIEGIGAKTKAYYWTNEFIREFIATLVSERKVHCRILIELMAIILIFSMLIYAMYTI